MRLALMLGGALSLLACDRMPEPKENAGAPAPVPTATASASASTPNEAVMKLARDVKDRGLEVAKTCVILSPVVSANVDACSFDEGLGGKYKSALSAFEEHDKAHPEEVRGGARVFLVTARMFGDWTAKAVAYRPHRSGTKATFGYDDMSSSTRGTLRLFQDFADTWNALAPSEPIPVDPVEEFRVYGHSSNPLGYDVKKVPKPQGGRLRWVKCFDGPCLLAP
jgi:hypothetical protein